jgi:RimJ/RimL family protein N-acetyltransferase
MLDHAFRFVERVHFSIGAGNLRSQIAIQRLGAKKISEAEIAYVNEPPALNFIYEITKTDWRTLLAG